jgi:hypothetical protein
MSDNGTIVQGALLAIIGNHIVSKTVIGGVVCNAAHGSFSQMCQILRRMSDAVIVSIRVAIQYVMIAGYL